MNDYNDFDSDTPPQGGLEDDLDAEFVRQAESQAEEQQHRDKDGDEYQAKQAEQRRRDDQRQDDDRRDADNRRDDIQKDIDRRDDQDRAQHEAQARQAEVDAGLDFGGVEDAPAERSEGDKLTQDAKDRHGHDMDEHRQKAVEREADQALQAEQSKDSFYKGGFTDLKGNQVSVRDVNAIMANDKATGGHQAAQERFGLATEKGSELATAYYAEKEAKEAQRGAPDTPSEPAKPAAAVQDKDAEFLREVDRLNPRLSHPGENDQDFRGQDEHQEQASEGTNWTQYMGMNENEAKATADRARALQAEEKYTAFLPEKGSSQADYANLTPSTDVAELSDRLNDPTTAEGQAALAQDQSTDWSERQRESEAEQERQREREAQSQDQGMQHSR